MVRVTIGRAAHTAIRSAVATTSPSHVPATQHAANSVFNLPMFGIAVAAFLLGCLTQFLRDQARGMGPKERRRS